MMTYYVKDGDVVARSYNTSHGTKFEIGKGGSKASCIMSSFVATKSIYVYSRKDLLNEIKSLGTGVETIVKE